jgi:hypothetical protein
LCVVCCVRGIGVLATEISISTNFWRKIGVKFTVYFSIRKGYSRKITEFWSFESFKTENGKILQFRVRSFSFQMHTLASLLHVYPIEDSALILLRKMPCSFISAKGPYLSLNNLYRHIYLDVNLINVPKFAVG